MILVVEVFSEYIIPGGGGYNRFEIDLFFYPSNIESGNFGY